MQLRNSLNQKNLNVLLFSFKELISQKQLPRLNFLPNVKMLQKNSLKAFFACERLIKRTKSIKLIIQNIVLRTSASNLMLKKV